MKYNPVPNSNWPISYEYHSGADDNISYALLESEIQPDIQSKSSRSHEAGPSVIWMTEGG